MSSTPSQQGIRRNGPQCTAASGTRLRHHVQPRRIAARIRHAHARARAVSQRTSDSPVSPRPSTNTDFSLQFHHLNLSVAKPISTSSIVIIQKRTTTCVSFQPFCS